MQLESHQSANSQIKLTQFNKVYYIKITKQNTSKSENSLADSDKITNFAVSYERDEIPEQNS